MYREMNVGEAVKKICKEKGISVSALEKELEWSNGVIGRWGKTSPSIDKIFAVADQLGISLDELFGVKKEKYEIKETKDSLVSKIISLTGRHEIIWKACNRNSIHAKIVRDFEAGTCTDFKVYSAEYKGGQMFFSIHYMDSEEGITGLEPHFYLSVNGQKPEEEAEEKSVLTKLLEAVDDTLYAEWNAYCLEEYRKKIFGK